MASPSQVIRTFFFGFWPASTAVQAVACFLRAEVNVKACESLGTATTWTHDPTGWTPHVGALCCKPLPDPHQGNQERGSKGRGCAFTQTEPPPPPPLLQDTVRPSHFPIASLVKYCCTKFELVCRRRLDSTESVLLC